MVRGVSGVSSLTVHSHSLALTHSLTHSLTQWPPVDAGTPTNQPNEATKQRSNEATTTQSSNAATMNDERRSNESDD